MRSKLSLFKESIKLVWRSAPGWALSNSMLSFLRSFLPLALIWLIKYLIDGITDAANSSGSLNDDLLILIIAVAVVWLINEATSDLGFYIRKKQSVKLESYMYGLLHEKAVSLDLQYFEDPTYYDCLARATREAPWRPNSIVNNIVMLFRGTISFVLMAGVLFSFHWSFVLILLVVNLPAIYLRLHYADVLYDFSRDQTSEARKAQYFNWILTGSRSSRELRLFGLGSHFISLFKKSFLNTKEEELDIVRKRTLIDIVADTFKAVAAFAILFIIAKNTINGKLTLGEMSMYILAFRQGMFYLKDIFTSVGGLYEDYLFVGDTFEYLSLESKIKSFEPVVEINDLTNGISVNNVSFTYPGSDKASVDDVSFEIGKGEVVALVGHNGSGKSTLARLLCRLYDPEKGCIRWDNDDIKNYDPSEFRKQVSVVFQDFMLYNATVGENITMGDVSVVDEKKMRDVATTVGVNDLIESLPRGYDTVIGTLFDDSRELSWGEWQKLAISRALYRESSLLILDEPSSALDADTEYEIFTKFREIVKGRTSILISHRFSNVSLADKIIVLEKGRVVEMGQHDELMKRKGIYYSMFTKQNRDI